VAVRAPRFVYPRGYGYRRWSVGAILPLLFLNDQYYVDWDYRGLPPPGPGEEWVRYGPDAVLVDIYSGRVLDIVYGVFY
jgi:Ni/Co efflux regulator RcnB